MLLGAERRDDDLVRIDAEADELIANEPRTLQREPNVVGFGAVAIGVAIDHDKTVEILLGPGRHAPELGAGGVGEPELAGVEVELGQQADTWVLAHAPRLGSGDCRRRRRKCERGKES
jgi:hypothetical protein